MAFHASMPQLFDILKGQVVSLQSYGAFIQLSGFEKQGLLHVSQISNSKVDDPADVLEKNETVWCKVISVADGKLGLSMKLVNQTTGKDLDPGNVQSSFDEQRRKGGGGRREKAPIQLDAVLDTKCRKCGGSGHIAQDCFHTPGGKKYDLLEEEEKPIFAGPNQLKLEQQKAAKKKKDKHKKKSKRHKKVSSSDSDTSEDEERSHRKAKRRKSGSQERRRRKSASQERRRRKSDTHEHKKRKKGKKSKRSRYSSSSSD